MPSDLKGLSNCVQCGKIYLRITSAFCPDCLKQDRENLENVRDYLRFNRGASMEETVSDTGVDPGRIVAWIQAGHLMLSPQSAIKYPCENKCGSLIQSGKYCRECLHDLSRSLEVQVPEPRNRGHGFLSKDKF
ncbi:hypothetical protein AN477_06990 [Alicyclobacillus ferrooxydans]|uniref:Flagellar protein n=1 Tax=Alicyclobacillus ferrooxydans TaxID=471514 RepID=A0A0P9D4I0_9BACL|nr:hypothetical protein AN477_06990 [Alicyclobacillus ferrooxydans]